LFTVVGIDGGVWLTSRVLGGEFGAVVGPGSLVVAPQPTHASTIHIAADLVNSDIWLLLLTSDSTAVNMKQRRYPAVQLGGLVVAAAFALLWLAERKRPLRRRVEPVLPHQARNAAVAALAAATVQLAEMPVVAPIAALVASRRVGLLGRMPHGWLRTVLSLLLLDYSLYVWHVLTHRVPLLWRFHAVHHVDLDLDASTAVRFHFGELALSVPWRAAQVALIGVSPRDLRLWQQALLVSILFHHSNVRLPRDVERAVAVFIMTPHLHGIHHANEPALRDCNWSSGLSIWDRIHGTYRHDVPQAEIRIGVEGHEEPQDVALPRILAMPFTDALPAGGRTPA
jgi:sterol desaturase/sphingolipid hydroxylase (fatty acid hydroxylase superfamily)